MKVQIAFRAYTGKAALEIEIPDDTESPFHMRAAVYIAIKGGANLAGANLAGANLAGANLVGADLTGAYLVGADLTGAKLADANLAGADLAGAYLAGANLVGADLTGAKLADAYLAGAYLAGADLVGAYLAGAYLAGANLAGANLVGADLTGADLADAKYGKGLKLAGGAVATKAPLQIHGLTWPVVVSDRHIQIGCEVHETEIWHKFSDREIAAMDGTAAFRFWKRWKDVVLAAADAHQSKIEQKDTAE